MMLPTKLTEERPHPTEFRAYPAVASLLSDLKICGKKLYLSLQNRPTETAASLGLVGKV